LEVDEEDDINMERTISRLLLRRTLREFVGISPEDRFAIRKQSLTMHLKDLSRNVITQFSLIFRPAIDAMINFSFYLCVGEMDNAFKGL
jgi:hypothetical protein